MTVVFRPDEVLDLAFAVSGDEDDHGNTRMSLSGEFDLAGIPLFAQELERLQARGRDVELVDLAELVFIDAVGLHAVMDVREGAGDGRPPPALVGAGAPVARVFELVGLEHHLADRR